MSPWCKAGKECDHSINRLSRHLLTYYYLHNYYYYYYVIKTFSNLYSNSQDLEQSVSAILFESDLI